MTSTRPRSPLARILTFVLLVGTVATCQADDAAPAMPPVLLQMIRDPQIHQTLGLSVDQRDRIQRSLREVDGRWFRARNFAAEQQQAEIEKLTSELDGQLNDVLDRDQIERLRQLERQALGTRMMMRADVSQILELTAAQTKSLGEVFSATDRTAEEIQSKLQAGELSSATATQKLSQLKDQERESLAALLTTAQRSKIGSLTGTPFDFSKVTRIYPLAPELVREGVTWIQGDPLRLEDLRGKVVAVHFYAFQCINCQRNLPHYQSWHEDLADQGLVVIGIQTPETPSERSLEKVTAAAKDEGIRYPLLLDAESANWKAWNNTMWPTVYLVDKQGFLRRWWQGEMNWQGTAGEKQMRETIEQLLEESQ